MTLKLREKSTEAFTEKAVVGFGDVLGNPVILRSLQRGAKFGVVAIVSVLKILFVIILLEALRRGIFRRRRRSLLRRNGGGVLIHLVLLARSLGDYKKRNRKRVNVITDKQLRGNRAEIRRNNEKINNNWRIWS